MVSKRERQEAIALAEGGLAEQTTGCAGAGDFAKWARARGYPHCEVLNWCSSAGDWQFVVSEDGKVWFPMTQENNYPQGPGFTREVHKLRGFEGTAEEALEHFSNGW